MSSGVPFMPYISRHQNGTPKEAGNLFYTGYTQSYVPLFVLILHLLAMGLITKWLSPIYIFQSI